MAFRGLFISVAFLTGVAGLFPSLLQARTDPALRWRTLESGHFQMHYYEQEETLAREFLAMAEEAHYELKNRFGFEPPRKVHLVLVDDVDQANGYAMVLPYDTILLYGYAPDVFGELGFWSDWKRILIYHELTHIFQISRVRGLPWLGNLLLGRTFLPNSAMPGWFTEGLAVLTESTIGAGGRIGSPKFEMFLRVQYDEDQLFEIDEVTGSPLDLPRGSTMYLYGSYFIHWLAQRSPEGALAALVNEQAGKVNPFSINISARRHLGATFVELFDEWKKDLRSQFKSQLASIRSAGVVEGEHVAYGGEALPMPSGTAEGALLWYRNDGHAPAQLVRRSAEGDEVRVAWCQGGCDRPQELPDGRILFSSLEYFDTFYFYQDLFVMDGDGRHRQRLTWGERVKDPSASPDGTQVAYVVPQGSHSVLRLMDLGSGDVRDLTVVEGGLSWPSWSPDGRRIAVAVQQGGRSDIEIVDSRSGERTPLTVGPAFELHPTWSADGRWVIFVSTLDGVYNLYAMNPANWCTSRLTRVAGGALAPTVSRDGQSVFFASYHRQGYELYRLPFSPGGCDPVQLAAVPAHRVLSPSPPTDLTTVESLSPGRYCPICHIHPRSWSPSFLTSSLDTTLIGLTTSGSDPAGKITYTASFDINTVDWDTATTLSLSLDFMVPLLSIFAGYYDSTSLARINGQYLDYDERDLYATASLTFPFPGSLRSYSLSLGYSMELFSGRISEPWEYDPAGTEPYIPVSGRLASLIVSAAFDNTQNTTYSIGPVRGTRLDLEARYSAPPLGSEWTEYQAKWRLSQYFPNPWLEDHSLLAHLRGGYSAGRDKFLRTFSVGGYPDQDILSDLMYGGGVNGLYLRGYPSYASGGRQYHYVSLDYRFPVWRIRRGLQTYPIFVKDLWIDLFGNGAGAFDEFSSEELLWGAGGEVKLSFLLGNVDSFTLSVGAAHGFSEPGGFSVYFVLGN